jgi:ArsR family transcriptional regulator
MIELLGPATTSAVGIDRSPEMLRFARARMGRAGIERVDLRQGDMYALPLEDGAADTVVLHQVLHYAQAPAAAIAEAARLIGRDGRLLIVDFAAHDREELREREGHARLGFDDDQMAHWFAAAGLEPARTLELAGGELTVKLWLARRSADAHRLRAVG